MKKLTPAQKTEISRFIKEDIRVKGMNLVDAENLAWQILYEARDKAGDFISNLMGDLAYSWDKVKKGEVE